jgi:hypothetical protein
LAETVEDKRQIGLTLAGSEALGKLMEEGLFDSESDAYKLAIAYALAKGVHPDAAPSGGYQTKFNAAGGIDIDGQVRDLISVLLPDCSERPYAAAERLAEVGLCSLAARISAKESLADLLEEVLSVSPALE